MAEESEPGTRDPFVGREMAGKYHLDAFLGAGAMGRVYRATQRPLDKIVAVKILNANLLADEATQQRFLREAQAASRIDHPNSVAVFDFGHERDGTAFIVMEYLRGESLGDLLQREGRLSAPRCVAIMSQVLAALGEAHEQGVVHRDVKPENIMLVARTGDDGHQGYAVKVADFGIAKMLDDDVHGNSVKLTATGVIPGSPAYMSPEQALAREVDGRSDLYQCGVILYEMITGEIPFGGDSAIEVIMRHINDPAPSPRDIAAGCPSALAAVVLRAMEKDPARRYPDARAMRHALKVVAPDQVAATAPLTRSVRPAQLMTIQPSVAAAGRATPSPLLPPRLPARAPVVRERFAMASAIVVASVGIAGVLVTLHPATTAARPHAVSAVSPAADLPESRGEARTEVGPESMMVFEPETTVEAPPARPVVVTTPRRVPSLRMTAARIATPVSAAPALAQVERAPEIPMVIEAAPAPAPVAVVAAPVAVVAAPAPMPALRGIDGSVVAMQVSGGLTRSALQGRATEAADSLARCVFRSVANDGTALMSPLTVSGSVTVRDRRVDEVRLSGSSVPGECRAAVMSAFHGDLPQAEDAEYEVRLTMRLAPRR